MAKGQRAMNVLRWVQNPDIGQKSKKKSRSGQKVKTVKEFTAGVGRDLLFSETPTGKEIDCLGSVQAIQELQGKIGKTVDTVLINKHTAAGEKVWPE